MSKSVYICNFRPYTGKSILSLGMLDLMLRKSAKVAYFRPIIYKPKSGKDNHIQTAITYFNLSMDYEQAYAFTREQVVTLLGEGKIDNVLNTILSKYKQLEELYDYVLVEGSDFSDKGNVMNFDMNVMIAKNLNIPVWIIGAAHNQAFSEALDSIQLMLRTFLKENVTVFGIVMNRVLPENIKAVIQRIKAKIPKNIQVDVLPEHIDLSQPTVREVNYILKGEILFGVDYLGNIIYNYVAGAMQLRNYLTRIKDRSLIVTPGDRADIILGALQANSSSNYPSIAGIILTGGLIPEKSVLKLIEGSEITFPIICVKKGTFRVTNEIGMVKAKLDVQNTQRMVLSLDIFNKYVNAESIAKKLTLYHSDKLTSRMFQFQLQQKAKQNKKHIVLPEGTEDRILKAVFRLQQLDLVNITLLGEEQIIRNKVKELDLAINFEKIQVLNPLSSKYNETFEKVLYECRKHKGMTPTLAKDLVMDVSYYATLMVHTGIVDAMVSGAIHTTQHTIKPALQIIKTKKGVSAVSSVFFMCLPDRVSVMGDCAINPNPNAQQLAEIALISAQSSKDFGIPPKVAMLSYSSGVSGKGAEVEKVREATQIALAKNPYLDIEGPIQYDAAVDTKVARTKMPNSKVAGKASVLIFPDLNTGNNTYKAIQRETGALAIGPMLQGLNKPVNDLSRGCTVKDIFNTVLLTAIQAQS